MMSRQYSFAGYFILVLGCTILSVQVRSQPDYHILTGETVPSIKGNVFPRVFCAGDTFYLFNFHESGHYFIKDGEPGLTIESFDKGLNHSGSIPFRGSFGDFTRLQPFQIFFAANEFLVFAAEFSINEGTARSTAFKMNPQGEVTLPAIPLGEITGLEQKGQTLYAAEEASYFSTGIFHCDTVVRYLYVQRFPFQFQATTKLMIKVLDNQLSILRNKLLNLAIPPMYAEFSDMLLVNDELFFIVTIQLPLEDKLFKLATYNFDRDEISYYDFSLEGKTIHTLDVSMLEKGNIMIHGLYAGESSRQDVDGVFYFLFGEDNQTLHSTGFAKIPVDQFRSVGKGDLPNLKIRQASVRSNGDVILLTEFRWTEVISFSDSEGKLYLRPNYHSNDLLLISFTNDGTCRWQTWIPRKFASAEEKALGFHAFMTDSAGYLFYNDHPDNLTVFDPDRAKTVRNKYQPVVAKINLAVGTYRKYPLSSHPDKLREIAFFGDFVFNISDDTMIWINTHEGFHMIGITFSASGWSRRD